MIFINLSLGMVLEKNGVSTRAFLDQYDLNVDFFTSPILMHKASTTHISSSVQSVHGMS
jgi:hypothetical protein